MKMLKLFTLFFISIPLLSFSQDLSATAILDSIVNRYQSLPAYQDTGRITCSRIVDEIEEPFTFFHTFSSFFLRPNYYEIEAYRPTNKWHSTIKVGIYYNERNEENKAWKQRGDLPKEVTDRPLDHAITVMAGETGGMSSFTSRLLMPEKVPGKYPIMRHDTLIRLPDEKIRDQDCYQLLFKYKHDMNNPLYTGLLAESKAGFRSHEGIYWVRKSDFMIIRIKTISDKITKKWVKIVDIYPLPEAAQKLEPRKFVY